MTLFDTIQLPPATTQKTAVLKMLIETDGVSEQQTPFNGFRTRISELKLEHELPIQTKRVDFTTQFGRSSAYNVHYLHSEDKMAAVELFNELNKSGK